MRFKEYTASPCELRYMTETLSLHTPYAMRILMEKELVKDLSLLDENYRKLRLLKDISRQSMIFGLLCNVKDIENSIRNVSNGSLLQETELFEIKNFAFYSMQISRWICDNAAGLCLLPDLSKVFEILDPDNYKVTSFYIYNSYSPVLAELREEFKAVQMGIIDIENASQLPDDERKRKLEYLRVREGELITLIELEEEKVRKDLSGRIAVYKTELADAFAMIGELDLLLAKSIQMKELELCFPTFSCDGKTKLKGMFHPMLRSVLEKSKKEYQPVDICFEDETICITGANMGGKTVAIKTTGLVQILFQFGFGIPAAEAEMTIKDEILFSIEEGQNMREGLSSFAAEMLGINRIIKHIMDGSNVLALIDEPARTTNPAEGTALVSSLIELLRGKVSTVLVTTHYDIEDENIRRYRVKGFIDGKMNYTLIEAVRGDVPKEALTIARSIGVDEKWISLAENYMNTHINNN